MGWETGPGTALSARVETPGAAGNNCPGGTPLERRVNGKVVYLSTPGVFLPENPITRALFRGKSATGEVPFFWWTPGARAGGPAGPSRPTKQLSGPSNGPVPPPELWFGGLERNRAHLRAEKTVLAHQFLTQRGPRRPNWADETRIEKGRTTPRGPPAGIIKKTSGGKSDHGAAKRKTLGWFGG